MRLLLSPFVLTATLLVPALATALTAQSDDPCARQQSWDSDSYRHCEVREEQLGAPGGPLTVDATPNGGITVEAWDEPGVRVRAVVTANAPTEQEARELAGRVQLQVGGDRVSATGPERAPDGQGRSRDNRWWSVSYRVSVPRSTALDLLTRNGGIVVRGVHAAVRFDTTNGGVQLDGLGGSVVGRTRNGGVKVALTGSRWDGEGLDVETTNGGVTIEVPQGYSARFEASTVNGGVRSDIPVAGELGRNARQLSATLGSGGAPVRVRTRNGGVRINSASGR
jgi:hypothetical protein